ncbi:MAG: hypothetical protein IT393_06245 [Nitrospirae bacterium]|nr:hypothetical protein [Nitrospirota bacterium]
MGKLIERWNMELICAGVCLTLSLFQFGCRGKQSVPESGSPSALLYEGRCGMCHQVYHPLGHTYTGWIKVVSRMEKNAETVGIRPLLTEEEKNTILAYLKKHAIKGF